MQPKNELYWSISLVAGGVTAEYAQFPFNWLVSTCLVVAAIAFLLDYISKPTTLKTYLRFIYKMEKEGEEIKKSYPDSEQDDIDQRVNHFEWARLMVHALDFIFPKPEKGKGIHPSLLFKNERSDANWQAQLRMNLQAFTVLKKINSGLFSDNFRKAPEALEEVYKSYLAKKR